MGSLDMKQTNVEFLRTPSKDDIAKRKNINTRFKRLVKDLILLIILLHNVILE